MAAIAGRLGGDRGIVEAQRAEPSQALLGFATLDPTSLSNPTRPYSKGIHGWCGFMMMQPSSPTAQMS